MKQRSLILALCMCVYSNHAWSLGADTPELMKLTVELVKLVNLAKKQYDGIIKTKSFVKKLKDIETVRDVPLEYIYNDDIRQLVEDVNKLDDMYENPYQYPDDRVIDFRKAIKTKWKNSDYNRAGIYTERVDQLSKRMKNINKVEKSTNKNYEISMDNNTERDATNLTATSTAFLANIAAQKQKKEEQQKLFDLNEHSEMENTIQDTESLYGAMGALGKGD